MDQVTLDIRSVSNKAVLKSNLKTYLFRMALIRCSNATLSFCLYAAFSYCCYVVVLLSFWSLLVAVKSCGNVSDDDVSWTHRWQDEF